MMTLFNKGNNKGIGWIYKPGDGFMAITNRERIGKGLDFLASGFPPFVQRELKSQLGDNWLHGVPDAVNGLVEAGVISARAGKMRLHKRDEIVVQASSLPCQPAGKMPALQWQRKPK